MWLYVNHTQLYKKVVSTVHIKIDQGITISDKKVKFLSSYQNRNIKDLLKLKIT